MTEREVFFAEQKEQSAVKATIVQKYFFAWARVMKSQVVQRDGDNARIAYLDLFAGPGRYESGAKSTPLLILEKAIADVWLRDHLVTIFNDKDEENTKDLQNALAQLPDISSMRHPPRVMNKEVGTEMVGEFNRLNMVPTLFFVDPWGYKGLSLKLINSVMRNWGCDCIFFFNYGRINAGLSNPKVRNHMAALFGEERAEQLCAQLDGLTVAERETAVVEALAQALRELGGKYVLPFQFLNSRGSRTSHYLIFVSKHHLGYDIMKDIMASESSLVEQEVAAFRYCEADARSPLLFELNKPLDALAPMLMERFGGQELSVESIFRQHNVGTPYILKNYKKALLQIESSGQIQVRSLKGKRRTGTMAEHLLINFPPRRP